MLGCVSLSTQLVINYKMSPQHLLLNGWKVLFAPFYCWKSCKLERSYSWETKRGRHQVRKDRNILPRERTCKQNGTNATVCRTRPFVFLRNCDSLRQPRAMRETRKVEGMPKGKLFAFKLCQPLFLFRTLQFSAEVSKETYGFNSVVLCLTVRGLECTTYNKCPQPPCKMYLWKISLQVHYPHCFCLAIFSKKQVMWQICLMPARFQFTEKLLFRVNWLLCKVDFFPLKTATGFVQFCMHAVLIFKCETVATIGWAIFILPILQHMYNIFVSVLEA